jgi:hypothetical protein
MLIVLDKVRWKIKDEHRELHTESDTLFESIIALRVAPRWVYA